MAIEFGPEFAMEVPYFGGFRRTGYDALSIGREAGGLHGDIILIEIGQDVAPEIPQFGRTIFRMS